jgi:hypothetical protein
MTKRILKKDRLKFEKEVNTFFDRICHIKPRRVASDAFEDYRYLKTKYGLDYEIRCVEADGKLFNVEGAFVGSREDYARLRENGIDCNPFTGKWNFHLMDCTPEEAAAHIVRGFKIILPEGGR